jgi:hypothetical protein
MADAVFNIAKGRIVELANRVNTNAATRCPFGVLVA